MSCAGQTNKGVINMPQGDGTGPLGKGPGVGRNPGFCRRDPERQGYGRGKGRGRNQGAIKGPWPGKPQERDQVKKKNQ